MRAIRRFSFQHFLNPLKKVLGDLNRLGALFVALSLTFLSIPAYGLREIQKSEAGLEDLQKAFGPFPEKPTASFPASGLEERSFPESRTLATADKYILELPGVVANLNNGFLDLSHPTAAPFNDQLRNLLDQPSPPAGRVRLSLPQGHSMEVDLRELWEAISGRETLMAVPTAKGPLLVAPAQLVLVETHDRPFVSAQLVASDPKRVGFHTVHMDEPIPEGAYRVSVQIAAAGRGILKRGLVVYLPRILLEQQGPISLEGLRNVILLEALVDLARRVLRQEGGLFPENLARTGALRREFRRAMEEVGVAEGLARVYGAGGVQETQEGEWTRRVTASGSNRPTEAALATVFYQFPDRIVEFLTALDRLDEFRKSGGIRVDEELAPYTPHLLNSLASILVKNRVPVGDPLFLHRVVGSIRYAVTEDTSHFDLNDKESIVWLSRSLLVREEGAVPMQDFEERLQRFRKRNPELDAQYTREQLLDIYWTGEWYRHLRAENAHAVDLGLARLRRDELGARDDTTEFQEFLEHLTSEIAPSGKEASARLPRLLVWKLLSQMERLTHPPYSRTYKHKRGRDMLYTVTSHILRRWKWPFPRPTLLTVYPTRNDFYQSILWVKLLSLTSTNPDFVEYLVVQSGSLQDFLDKARTFLADQIQEMEEAKRPQEDFAFIENVAREFSWVRAYYRATGHLPPVGAAGGLEEVARVETPKVQTPRETIQGQEVVVRGIRYPWTGKDFHGWYTRGDNRQELGPNKLLSVLEADDHVLSLVLPPGPKLGQGIRIFRHRGVELRSDLVDAVGAANIIDLPKDPEAAAAMLRKEAKVTDIVLLLGVSADEVGRWVPESVRTPVLLFDRPPDAAGLAPSELASFIEAARSRGFLHVRRLDRVTLPELDQPLLVIRESA